MFRTSTLPDPDIDPQFYDGVPARRLAAFAIDLVVVLVIDTALLVVLGVLGIVTFGLAWWAIVPALLVSGFLYRWAMLTLASATIGMILTGIEIRGADGRRLDRMQALIHTGAFHLCMLSMVLLFVSMGSALLSRRGQLLHDFPIGSTAINRPE